jgi:hypothetical protein
VLDGKRVIGELGRPGPILARHAESRACRTAWQRSIALQNVSFYNQQSKKNTSPPTEVQIVSCMGIATDLLFPIEAPLTGQSAEARRGFPRSHHPVTRAAEAISDPFSAVRSMREGNEGGKEVVRAVGSTGESSRR